MAKSFSQLPTFPFPSDAVITGRLPTALAQLALAHGPIFQLRTDSEGDFVFMVGPEANRFVLHTHREHFSHDRGWTPIVGDWLGHGLLNMDPPEHTLHRRLMNPAFTSSYLGTYLPLMQSVIAERTRPWPAIAEIDLQEEAREIAFDVAALALTGLQAGPAVDRLRQLFYGLLHGFDNADESWEQFQARRDRMIDDLNALLRPIIAERRRLPAEAQPRDVLARIVQATDERGATLTNEQILAHVKILLVAGHETTTSLSAWALYLLATRPADLARVQSELDALGLDSDEPVSFEGLRALRFLDAFLKETGRLYAPVLNVPRGVLRAFEFGGHEIPEDVPVRLALAAGHRLPTVFRDPEGFDPVRFLPPRDEDAATPYGLATFGGGPRTCIGMSFAQVEVKALVAHVVRRLRLAPSRDDVLVPAGFWTSFVPTGMWVRARAA